MNAYGDLVWSLARRFLRNPTDAEDAVQDVFIDLWNSASRYDPQIGGELAFVATVARRRLIDRIRRRQRQPPTDSLDEQIEEIGDVTAAAIPPLDEDAEVAVIERALATLPAAQQEILALAIHEGYSHSEIAERLGLPLGTVKTKVRRGLIHLRETLQISAPGDETGTPDA